VPSDFHAQLQILFEQQQAIFKQWIKPSPDAFHKTSADNMQAASKVASQAAGFIKQSTQIFEQLKSNTLDQLQLDTLIKNLSEQTQQATLNGLLKQWQIPEQLLDLLDKNASITANPLLKGWQHSLLYTSPELHAVLQERLEAGYEHLTRYQSALRAYLHEYTSITDAAAKRLRIVLNQDGTLIESFTQLHDIWVDCYEDVYAEVIRRESYQEAHGEITNAYMQLTAFQQEIQLASYEQQGLATHKGLDSTLRRQKILRKEMREVKQQLEEQRLLNEELSRALVALNQQFEQLGGNLVQITPQAIQE